MLAKYGNRSYRGQNVFIQPDWLGNPLILPPPDLETAGNPENVRISKKKRTFNILYREKCGNATLLPYMGGTGREWVTTSRAWNKAHGDSVSKYKWCRGGSVNEVPELRQVLIMKSAKPRPERAVTVVTQLSLERSEMLEQQCSLWPHPIAAVVYIPLLRGRIFSSEEGEWHLATLDHGIAAMKGLFEKLNALPDGCILDLEVVVEECCNKDIASMYPTNAVRNRALQLASSEVVLLLDADFVVDVSLPRALADPGRYEDLVSLLADHRAVVLPAFEAWDQGEWGKKVALEAVRRGKSYISAKFMYNVVIGFHMSHYPQGHEKTNFWRWMNSTDPYEVEYQIGFEPYIMMLKKFTPYYDERFRGYYWNKVQHLMHISLQDSFRFVVHPDAFVVHVPHKKPPTKIRTRRSGQKERNHVMFLEALEDMKNDRFAPVTSFPHLCLPPEMQRAAADAVTNEEQKRALLRMADEVVKWRGEERAGGGAVALAKARGQMPTTAGGDDSSDNGNIAINALRGSETVRQTVEIVENVIEKEAERAERVEEEEVEGDENAAAGADTVWEKVAGSDGRKGGTAAALYARDEDEVIDDTQNDGMGDIWASEEEEQEPAVEGGGEEEEQEPAVEDGEEEEQEPAVEEGEEDAVQEVEGSEVEEEKRSSSSKQQQQEQQQSVVEGQSMSARVATREHKKSKKDKTMGSDATATAGVNTLFDDEESTYDPGVEEASDDVLEAVVAKDDLFLSERKITTTSAGTPGGRKGGAFFIAVDSDGVGVDSSVEKVGTDQQQQMEVTSSSSSSSKKKAPPAASIILPTDPTTIDTNSSNDSDENEA